MLRVSRVIRLVAMGAVVCTGLWAQAQSTAQISGTIQDASGSAVPGADVKATQTDTGAVRATGFWELDMSLTRNFRVREKMVLQLRGEAFNLTNSFRSGIASGASAGAPGVNLNVNSPQFGQILNSLDPRILQVAAKCAF